MQEDTPKVRPKKKKRGCMFGCLIFFLAILVALLGMFGYSYYQNRLKKSAVEKEYNSIPDFNQE